MYRYLLILIALTSSITAQQYQRIPLERVASRLVMYSSEGEIYGIDYTDNEVYSVRHDDSLYLVSIGKYPVSYKFVKAAQGKQGTILILVDIGNGDLELNRFGHDGIVQTYPANTGHSITKIVDLGEQGVLLVGFIILTDEIRGTLVNSEGESKYLKPLLLYKDPQMYSLHSTHCNTTCLAVIHYRNEYTSIRDTSFFTLDMDSLSWIPDSRRIGGSMWTDLGESLFWVRGNTVYSTKTCKDSVVHKVPLPASPTALVPLYSSGQSIIFTKNSAGKLEAWRYTHGGDTLQRDAFLSAIDFSFQSVAELQNGTLVFFGDSMYALSTEMIWSRLPYSTHEFVPTYIGRANVFSDSVIAFSYNYLPRFLNTRTLEWISYTTADGTELNSLYLKFIGNAILLRKDTLLAILDRDNMEIHIVYEVNDKGDTIPHTEDLTGPTIGFQIDDSAVGILYPSRLYSLDTEKRVIKKMASNWKYQDDNTPLIMLGWALAVVSFDGNPPRVLAGAKSLGDMSEILMQDDSVLAAIVATTDGGKTWIRSTTGMPPKSICFSLAACADTVYAAVTNIIGAIPPLYEPATIIVSTDQGRSWGDRSMIPVSIKRMEPGLFVSNDGVVYAFTKDYGCYYSSNRGFGWYEFTGPWTPDGGEVYSMIEYAGYRYIVTTRGLYRTPITTTGITEQPQAKHTWSVKWQNDAFITNGIHPQTEGVIVTDIVGRIIPVIANGAAITPQMRLTDGVYIVTIKHVGATAVLVIR
ncbi:MAG: hypothetical protein D8M52_08685 [Chlorobi bacterium]|nr:MAG: hypothetical protein UZ06_CHB003002001 [Chlorobi bacterium OLB6]MBL1161777.1 hypothetical protein [Chlorobiota bacterium]MBV6464232.1 hypothetical protein [Chlorobiota bacterium]NOG68245.1 hypothetical protein [Chlorobiota bacterium]